MSITDLGAVRFAKASRAGDVPVIDMLREAIRQIESGEIPNAKHAIVVLNIPEDGHSRAEYLSAGENTVFESIGMLTHAAFLMSRG